MQVYYDCRNPVLPPDLHIPDPEAHVMPDGRVYVYGSWDQSDQHYCSHQYRVISSANMLDWADHGLSFDTSRVPWVRDPNAPRYAGTDWQHPTPFLRRMLEERQESGQMAQAMREAEPLLFAPDAIHRDGRTYLYFCLSDQSEGVAVSDRPEGPFDGAVQLPVGGIDPAVFIDDDAAGHPAQAYYLWGQFRARGARLEPGMMALVPGSEVAGLVTEEEHGFHEGSSLRKRGDTYYLVYCSIARGRATSLAYATSKSPLGPYTYGGIIIDNDGCDPQTWNNHGSIECVNGQWYVFYHRSSRNSPLFRRLCIEPIAFREDGSIPEVPMTSQGAGRPFTLGETIEAWRACGLSGTAYIAPDEAGREALTSISDGDEAIYRYVHWVWPASSVSAEGTGSGEITFCLDGEEVPAGRVVLQDGRVTESWFAGPPGSHELVLRLSRVEHLVLHGVTIA